MATYNRPASLPVRPPAQSSSRPTTSSSLRNVVRKRSASPDRADSEQAPTAIASTPVVKKGRYERLEGTGGAGGGILGKALRAATTQASPMTTPGTSRSAASTPGTGRTQFEQQQDFISFDFDDEPPNSASSRGRNGGSARNEGRTLDVYELKKEAHSQRVQKREKGRATPWCEEPGVDWSQCGSAIDMLNVESKAFITYISPTPIEHELRMWTVELIRRAIKSRWSDAEVECFGSVGTGLYLPGGDIDLVVLCPSFPSPPLKPTSSLLHSLASLLLTSSLAEPSSLLVIAKSRVPIVKFVTRHGGFSVDLSVNQKNGVDAAIGVRNLLENFSFRDEAYVEPGSREVERNLELEKDLKGKGRTTVDGVTAEDAIVDHGVARCLVLLVKAFLNQRGMNEVFTGGLGSYSIICLVVSFLQLHPKIQTGEIHPSNNIGLLFVEFLEYYGKHFNFDECGISLRKSGGYFNKHNKGWFRPNQPYLLSIEDPNDPSNDVSGGSHNIVRVRQTMAGAFEVLTATLCQRASAYSLLSSSSNPSATSYELSKLVLPTSDPSALTSLTQSVLGSVIGISVAQIASRENNVDLFNEGIIQSLIAAGMEDAAAGGSKKAMKKLWKEEKAKRSRDRTLAKLESRQKEREEKNLKKLKRKERLSAGGSAEGPEALGFVVDVVPQKLFKEVAPRAKAPSGGEDEDESRYSMTSKKSKTVQTQVDSSVTYVGNEGDDSDFSTNDGEEADLDVVMGGNDSGDKISAPVQREEEDMDAFILRQLKEAKTNLKKGRRELNQLKIKSAKKKGKKGRVEKPE